jgi:hypothetical protein
MKIEDLRVGQQVLDGFSKQLSTIVEKTNFSVRVYTTADKKSIKGNKKRLSDEEDGIEVGKLKGVNSTSWFYIDDFNKRFIELSLEEICNQTIVELKMDIDRRFAFYKKQKK